MSAAGPDPTDDATTPMDGAITRGRPADHSQIHLPRPTAWPLVCALAIALCLFGLISSLLFSVVGIALLALAGIGWIGEIRHDTA